MSTAAASGSGEPLERSNYRDGATLPRSGLLEPPVRADRRKRASRACGSLGALRLGGGSTGALGVWGAKSPRYAKPVRAGFLSASEFDT
jgi:hypothetical protein